jgi:hypothetical protein
MPTTITPKAPERTLKKRPTTTAPPGKYFQDVDTDRLNKNMSAFFHTWIPNTLDMFAHTGTALSARHFWVSQFQYELDHRLWRKEFLGREATDEERDWLVEAAMKVHWQRIQKALARQREAARGGSEKGVRKTKLRRAIALEESMGRMAVGEVEGSEDEIRDSAPDLTVWDIVANTSLERELRKVERDEKLGWMRAGKDGFGLQTLLENDSEREEVNESTGQGKALLDETLCGV